MGSSFRRAAVWIIASLIIRSVDGYVFSVATLQRRAFEKVPFIDSVIKNHFRTAEWAGWTKRRFRFEASSIRAKQALRGLPQDGALGLIDINFVSYFIGHELTDLAIAQPC